MPKYIRNKSEAILILFNGRMKLKPKGQPGDIKPLSTFSRGHKDLRRSDVHIMGEEEYLEFVKKRNDLNFGVAQAEPEPVEEEPEEDLEEPEPEAVPEEPEEEEVEEPEEEETEEEEDAPVEEEPEEEVEEDSAPAMSLEEFKSMEFSDKKDRIRMLGLEEEVSLRSNDSVDEGYEKYLNGDFE